jgi:adenosine deaminase
MMRAHFFPVKIVGIFFSDLSMEYAIAASTFSLTRQQMYELSSTGIDYLFADDTVKAGLRRKWAEWVSANQLN